MAIIQNPLIGRAKKQAGGMVFSTLYGKNVMRSKPFEYRDKNSTKQQNLRALFNAACTLAALLKFYAVSFFETQPIGMSAFSKLMSQLRTAFTGTLGAVVFNPSNKTLGSGSIPVPRDVNFTDNGGGNFTMTFDDDALFDSEKSTDTIKILVIAIDGSYCELLTTAATRTAGTVTAEVSAYFQGLGKDAYVSDPIFTAADEMTNSAIFFSGSLIDMTA
jgi:hypothetical protein